MNFGYNGNTMRAVKWDDDTEECGGCIYWDGDDGRCRNADSQHFMNESNDGCDKKCGQEMEWE